MGWSSGFILFFDRFKKMLAKEEEFLMRVAIFKIKSSASVS